MASTFPSLQLSSPEALELIDLYDDPSLSTMMLITKDAENEYSQLTFQFDWPSRIVVN